MDLRHVTMHIRQAPAAASVHPCVHVMGEMGWRGALAAWAEVSDGRGPAWGNREQGVSKAGDAVILHRRSGRQWRRWWWGLVASGVFVIWLVQLVVELW